jgi:long-subunit fatty acid transport protein
MKFLSFVLMMMVIVFAISPAFGQGEATVLFLMINPGARQGGMGEAGVAIADDPNAVYWNPAGLAFQYEDPETDRKFAGSLMHVQWLPQFNLDDLYYDWGAFRYYLEDVGMLGLGVQFINYGENIHTDVFGNEVDRFVSNEVAVTGSYGLKIRDNLGVGVGLKFIYSNLSPNIEVAGEKQEGRGSTFALDLGALYHPAFAKKLSLGAAISNIGPKMTYINRAQADPIPTNLRLGLSYRLLDSEFNKFTLVYDINRLLVHRDDESSDGVFKAVFYSSWTDQSLIRRFTHSIGAEYWYTDLIALRAGYFYEDDDFGGRKFWTFGGGLQMSVIGVDFSYIYASVEDHPLSDTMRFSLSFAM